MSELLDQSVEDRESNAVFINDTVIPNLHKKGFPLSKVLRILYRASTLGVRDSDFERAFSEYVGDMGKRQKLAHAVFGGTVVPPHRGDPSRALRILGAGPTADYLTPDDIRAMSDEIRGVPMTITRTDLDGVYYPPAFRVDQLAETLSSSIEQSLAHADTFQSVVPTISDFVLLYNALHPYVDGTGRTTRACTNYMAYPYNMQFRFPMERGSMKQDSDIVTLMGSFNDAVQIEEGYPIVTNAIIDGQHREASIDYARQSDSFERLLQERRENERLLPYYNQMDLLLGNIATPRAAAF